MSIPVTKYVDISTQYTSTRALNKSLSMRIFTTNSDMPSGTVLELTSLQQVGNMFANTSDEYKKASRYFNFTTLQGKSPSLISFYKYDMADASAFVLGSQLPADAVNELKQISNGTLTIDFGTATQLDALDFSSISTISDAIDILKAKWSDGDIVYDPVMERIKFTLTAKGVMETKQIAGTGDLLLALGLDRQVLSNGATASTVEATLQASTDMSDNYSSFIFPSLTADDDIVSCSVFANSSNSLYMFSVDVDVTAPTFMDLISQGEGTVVNYDNLQENTCVIPCAILASTDFTAQDGAERYMFANVVGMPAVVTDATYNTLDANNINYYGQTSKSGTKYSFYQDGVITGNAKYIEVYAGELFVKDDLQGKLLQLLLNTRRFPASSVGLSITRNTIVGSIDGYLKAGIIEPRELTKTEETLILGTYGQAMLDSVKAEGYGLDVTLKGTEIDYLLVYLSFVGVRKIVGSHNVIGV